MQFFIAVVVVVAFAKRICNCSRQKQQ